MEHRARADRAVVQLPRILLRGGDEVAHGLHRRIGLHDDDERIGQHRGDPREIAHRVVRQVLRDRGMRGESAADEDAACGRRASPSRRTTVPIRPPAPGRFSTMTFCPRRSESLRRDEPADDVGAAAGGKGRDEPDRARRGVGRWRRRAAVQRGDVARVADDNEDPVGCASTHRRNSASRRSVATHRYATALSFARPPALARPPPRFFCSMSAIHAVARLEARAARAPRARASPTARRRAARDRPGCGTAAARTTAYRSGARRGSSRDRAGRPTAHCRGSPGRARSRARP